MLKIDLLKELEYLIAFQCARLDEGDWDSFDRAEDKIKEVEDSIIHNSR